MKRRRQPHVGRVQRVVGAKPEKEQVSISSLRKRLKRKSDVDIYKAQLIVEKLVPRVIDMLKPSKKLRLLIKPVKETEEQDTGTDDTGANKHLGIRGKQRFTRR